MNILASESTNGKINLEQPGIDRPTYGSAFSERRSENPPCGNGSYNVIPAEGRISERRSEIADQPTELPISERRSENAKKKGRPGCFTAEWMAYLKNMFPEITTQRGLVNRAYAIRAISFLDNAAFDWLGCTKESVRRHQPMRYSVLTELGRIEDVDTLRNFAAEVCERKLPDGKAVAALRICRSAKKPTKRPGNSEDLASALIRCINKYLATHTPTPWEEVQSALEIVVDAVNESAEEDSE